MAIVVGIVLIVSGGGESSGGKNATAGAATREEQRWRHGGREGRGAQAPRRDEGRRGRGRSPGATTVALEIEPTAEVWACVLDANGKPLVDGVTLAPGETVGPFHSKGYTAAFGNG